MPGVAAGRQADGPLRRQVLIKARLAGRPAKPFRYIDYGNLATIGRKAAVADFGRIRLSGLIAWLLWSFAHLWFLVGFRNRIVVFVDWAWAYATFDRGARLITERRAHWVGFSRAWWELILGGWFGCSEGRRCIDGDALIAWGGWSCIW